MEAINGCECKPNDNPVPFAEFWQPGRIVSLWDMLNTFTAFHAFHGYWGLKVLADKLSTEGQIGQDYAELFDKQKEMIEHAVKSFWTKGVAHRWDAVQKHYDSGHPLGIQIHEIRSLFTSLENEFISRSCVVIDGSSSDLFKEEQLSEKAGSLFPLAGFHYREALRAYVFELYTASMFHSMRVAGEIIPAMVSRIFADERLAIEEELKVTIDLHANWQNVIKHLDKRVKRLEAYQNRPPETEAHLRELAKVLERLYAIKVAWRDPVSHLLNQVDRVDARNEIHSMHALLEQLAALSELPVKNS